MLIELHQVIPTLWITFRMRGKEIQYENILERQNKEFVTKTKQKKWLS